MTGGGARNDRIKNGMTGGGALDDRIKNGMTGGIQTYNRRLDFIGHLPHLLALSS